MEKKLILVAVSASLLFGSIILLCSRNKTAKAPENKEPAVVGVDGKITFLSKKLFKNQFIVESIISCPIGCTLSTNTSGAAGTTTVGNTTYTCRCSDGSTSAPTVS